MDRIKAYLSKVIDWLRTHMTVPNILAAVRLLLHRIKAMPSALHRRTPRMTLPNILATIFIVLVALVAPWQVPVLTYKLGAVAAGGCLGYVLDVCLFPYAKPSGYLRFDWRKVNDFGDDAPDYGIVDGYQKAFFLACARRAAIIACCVLAVALAL